MIYDISPPLTSSLAVWPGDNPLVREVTADIEKGDACTVSTFRVTAHIGAHVDAPSHFGKGAASIDQCPLDAYVGPCQVIRPDIDRGACVSPGHLACEIKATRVLLATDTYPDPTKFRKDYAGLDPTLVDWLSERGVKLVGIDTPSVDAFGAKGAPSHMRFIANDMLALEGLRLEGIEPGVYELIALPLKLVGFDASPVRAVLRSM